MEMYILFEFEGIQMVAKQTRFSKLERLYGFHFYDLTHPEEDEHFPDTIVKERQTVSNYWGSIMTSKPIEEVERNGYYYIADWGLNADNVEGPAPNEKFVNNTQFYAYDFYMEAMEQDINITGRSIDFFAMASLLDIIEPYSYPVQDLVMERSWNMPNKNTFEIKSIRELLKDELKGGLIIDPFANRNNYGHITNDLNEKYDTDFHMDALDFLRMFPDESVDVVLFDPPYSPRQVKEAYESVGLNTKGGRLTQASYWSDLKKEIARVLRIGGKSISFGWNSGGMNNKELFHINRIQLVAHGGNHNDTIVTVSVKKFSKIPEKKNDSRFDSKVNKQLSLF